jgi:polyisoprenoid-binding protein YceI
MNVPSTTTPDLVALVKDGTLAGEWVLDPRESNVRLKSKAGRTRPLSFDAVATVPGDGGIWLDAKVRVNRADFGLTWNQLGMVALNSDLTIHAVFTRQ